MMRLVLELAATLLLCVWLQVISSDPTGKLCPEVDGNSESCVCRSPKGILDLRALSNRNGTARFRGVADRKHYYYDFNPCQAFTDEGGCINVHVCQGANFDPTAHYRIADQGTEELWIDNDDGPYLYYTGSGNREVKVFLHCDRSLRWREDKLTTTGDSLTSLTYLFDLYSCHACPGGCEYVYKESKVGVIGFFLIAIVVLGFATYLTIGTIILKFHCGMTGRDIVPHREFWNELPYLVRDGFSFVFGSFVHAVTPQKERIQKRLDYESHL